MVSDGQVIEGTDATRSRHGPCTLFQAMIVK
jgi:hypothetical protein